VLKVIVIEVMGGGTFYVQTGGDQKIASIQQQLAALNLKDAPVIGAFNPKRGDIVFCYFHADKSWYWAMVVNSPRGPVESPTDMFEVFYIDYGNQEAAVSYGLLIHLCLLHLVLLNCAALLISRFQTWKRILGKKQLNI